MTAEEKAIRARREVADGMYRPLGLVDETVGYAIECATTVTPEEFGRAYEALISKLGQGRDWQALQAAFGAAGFEVKP